MKTFRFSNFPLFFTPRQSLGEFLKIKKLELVKPTNWDTLKTEGINFEQDFYWLEDAPMRAEINVLNKNHCNQKIIIVDLSKENELRNVMKFLNLARPFLP